MTQPHEILEPLSTIWWQTIIWSTVIISGILFAAKKLNKEQTELLELQERDIFSKFSFNYNDRMIILYDYIALSCVQYKLYINYNK